MDDEPLLSQEEIADRLEVVRQDGYRPDAVCTLLDSLLRYSRGPVSADAVREVVPEVPEDRLLDLLAAHVLPKRPGGLPWPPNLLAAAHKAQEELERRGFKVGQSSAFEWVVESPEGEIVRQKYRSSYDPSPDPAWEDRGTALWRLALRVVMTSQVEGGGAGT